MKTMVHDPPPIYARVLFPLIRIFTIATIFTGSLYLVSKVSTAMICLTAIEFRFAKITSVGRAE